MIVEIISQCIHIRIHTFSHISKHNIVHFKYITILFVNFTSTKLEKKSNHVTFRMQIQQSLGDETRVLIRMMTARLFFFIQNKLGCTAVKQPQNYSSLK